MSGVHAKAEFLPNGMEAVFINQPHWQTSSVRLIVNAGTLHEEPDSPTGVAHFFEHATFQGTDSFDSIEQLDTYSDTTFTIKNAFTGRQQTTYTADSYKGLEPPLKIVTQLALAPILSKDIIERERGPILDEARSHQFDPSKIANRKQLEAFAGPRYAALGTGTVEEVAEITHHHITSFYDKHYKAADMLLIICSSEPIELQREMATRATSIASTGKPEEPVLWNLPWLKNGYRTSAVYIDLPPSSQSHISVNYNLPSDLDLKGDLIFNIAGQILAKAARQRLRRDLGITYGPSGGRNGITNNNYGAKEEYGSLYVGTSTSGTELRRCYDEIINTIPKIALEDTDTVNLAIEGVALTLKSTLESPPKIVSESLPNSSMFQHHKVLDPAKLVRLVKDITADEVRQAIYDATEDIALIQVTSPDTGIIDEFSSN